MSNDTLKPGKCLYEYLKAKGKLEYGAVIHGDEIHKVLSIEYPKSATRAAYAALDFEMLEATDYVRNILLGQGMAFSAQRGDYRILLPSENHRYVERYITSADRKLKRALKLSRNMPKVDTADYSAETLITAKQAALKQQRVRSSNMA